MPDRSGRALVTLRPSSTLLRIAVTVLVILALIAVVFLLLDRRQQLAKHRPLSLPSINAELILMDGASIVRRGPASIVVLRFLGPVELRPFHFRADNIGATLPIEAWAEKLSSKVVFNAGQFDQDREYLGWLKRDGRWLSEQRKNPWKGLLVSGPTGDHVFGRIVDLEHADASVAAEYEHVVQSMMLFDASSHLRVRDSELNACRTIVAEDKRGRILVVVTEGAVTLGDLGRWLLASPLEIVRAMNLDGGVESQLVVDTPELKLAFYGQYGTGTTVWTPGTGQVRYPLPAVVAVRPLKLR